MPSPIIEIPEDNIFKNDLLGLEAAIAFRTRTLLARTPQAIAIDASWGSGKSTFMALWAAYLRNMDVEVVYFNAWETFLSDPLDALTRTLIQEIEQNAKGGDQSNLKRIKDWALRAQGLVSLGIKAGVAFHPESDFLEAANTVLDVVQLVSRDGEDSTSPPKISSLSQFKMALSAVAEEYPQPIVVMVDELDRCNPEYIVDMLHVLEHVFYAENVVFVVSVNHAELVHSVRTFYGRGFNAEGYLERFFDNVYSLPSSSRSQFIRSLLAELDSDRVDCERALPFLEASELSLREIDRAIRQLRGALDLEAFEFPAIGLLYLWVARSLAPVEYRKFISGDITDKDLADVVFSTGKCAKLRVPRQETNYRCARELEAMLILTSCYANLLGVPDSVPSPSMASELYVLHSRNREPLGNDANVQIDYSQRVVGFVDQFNFDTFPGSDVHLVKKSVELLDSDVLT